MKVIDYCAEEVSRQGHDITQLEGIIRVGWMLDAWATALPLADYGLPTVHDVIMLGSLIEQKANRHGLRTCGVTVGGHATPNPARVPTLLVELFELLRSDQCPTPMEFYKSFEGVHPFVDGNGRTGKILLNWVNGTLLDPIFPPDNLWGLPIRNP